MASATRIKQVVETNKNDFQFNVNRLAHEIGISYSYLYDVVNECFDMSPQQLIETVRMEEALRLIACGKKQVKIYKQLGYENIRTFREAFTKRIRMNFSTCRSRLSKKNRREREREVERRIDKLWQL